MSFNVGETVGPYRIMEQMGQGGMATVYKAYHAALDRYVALKVLHPAFLEEANFLTRFQREARLVAKLEHPSIVPIYDFSEHEGRPYLVMKFIEGETLKARLARGRLSPQEVADVIKVVGSALTYAHKNGILHRDIKPSNVLLSEDGKIYLADFGLARIAQSGESTITSDMILGTPQYISPEQAMGKRDLDEGTDIYSFGVMLYELSVGKVPFSADTPFSIIHDHIYTPLPLPRSINPEITPGVERVLLKALSKERSDRYKDVDSMVEAFVQAWAASMPEPAATLQVEKASKVPSPKKAEGEIAMPPAVLAPGEASGSTPKTIRKTDKRTRWQWVAGGVLVVVCCLFAFIVLRSAPKGLWRDTLSARNATRTAQSSSPLLPNPGIEELEQRVQDNPNDLDANLDLAIAYLEVDEYEHAYTQLESFIRVAGDNERFLLDAGEKFARRDAWVASAMMYTRVAEIYIGNNDALPDQLRDRMHESVYKAFEKAEAPKYVPFENIERIDVPLRNVAEARYLFYNQDTGSAQTRLDKALEIKPNFPEAMLLQGEFYAQEGRAGEARDLLNRLSRAVEIPPWIMTEINTILRTLQ